MNDFKDTYKVENEKNLVYKGIFASNTRKKQFEEIIQRFGT